MFQAGGREGRTEVSVPGQRRGSCSCHPATARRRHLAIAGCTHLAPELGATRADVVGGQASLDQAAIQVLHHLLSSRQRRSATLHYVHWHPVVGALCQRISIRLGVRKGVVGPGMESPQPAAAAGRSGGSNGGESAMRILTQSFKVPYYFFPLTN